MYQLHLFGMRTSGVYSFCVGIICCVVRREDYQEIIPFVNIILFDHLIYDLINISFLWYVFFMSLGFV
jgi:hypothetical protein